MARGPRIGVVGHVEWVLFGYADAVPRMGDILHLRDPFEEPAGGGAVAAITLARAGADVTFCTALAKGVQSCGDHCKRVVCRSDTAL